MSSPCAENIPLAYSVNQKYKPSRLIPEEGRWPSSPSVGMGCDGRGSVRRFLRRTKRCPRTAKSCGSGAATLAPSSAGAIPPATVTTSPLHREEHEVSRKTIAQGMPECLRFTCMLVCVFLCASWHTRPRVQRAPGIPCSLCFWREGEISRTRMQVASRDCGPIFSRHHPSTGRPEAGPGGGV